MLVDNGEMLVLGGVFERTKEFGKKQVPWLGDLPLLGHLFRTTTHRNNNELLIFVTQKEDPESERRRTLMAHCKQVG